MAIIASATTYLLFRSKLKWTLEKMSCLSVYVSDCMNCIDAANKRLDRAEKELAEIPVEDLKSAARKESLFFEGLQNIIDYGPESVESLNKEAIHSER